MTRRDAVLVTGLRRAATGALILSFLLPALPHAARAADASAADAGAAASSARVTSASGLAVLARPGAESAAWALAKEVYARPSLRPAALDERRARVLVGDAAAADAPQAIRDLADERAGIRSDDGASRALLQAIASQLNVRAIVVVEAGSAGTPSAKVFLVESYSFDAARYEPDAPSPGAAASPSALAIADGGAPTSAVVASDGGMAASVPAVAPPSEPLHWGGAVASLDRGYGARGADGGYGNGGAASQAGPLATSALPPASDAHKVAESRPFYVSPWFWGAVGAAVFGGAAVYFATRDNTAQTIHLELQVR